MPASRPRTRRSARASRPAMAPPPGASTVFTDGACAGNPGPGGWAWASDEATHAAGHEPGSTNQRMEVRAAYEAVLAHPGPLLVVSDSTYVVNCFRDGWWRGWLARGWLNSAKQPVANRDLWEPFVAEFQRREAAGEPVAFNWVKGHSGHAMNDLVDRLAVEASRDPRLTGAGLMREVGSAASPRAPEPEDEPGLW